MTVGCQSPNLIHLYQRFIFICMYLQWFCFYQVAWICVGNVEECKKFFETLYKFVYVQGTYLKPHVSFFSFSFFWATFHFMSWISHKYASNAGFSIGLPISYLVRLNFLLKNIQVAIMDGITMGCGAGISLVGMFRLVTDKTVCGCSNTLLAKPI